MNEFKVGDIVKLICHPQEMVVHYIGTWDDTRSGTEVKKPVLSCVWIDDYGQPHDEKYVPEVLEMVSESDLETKPPEPLKRKKVEDTLFREDDPELQGG